MTPGNNASPTFMNFFVQYPHLFNDHTKERAQFMEFTWLIIIKLLPLDFPTSNLHLVIRETNFFFACVWSKEKVTNTYNY